MGEIVGSVGVAVYPETRAFGPQLARQVTSQSARAGQQAGRAFGGSFTRTVGAVAGGTLLGGGILGAITAVRRQIVASVRAGAEQEAQNRLTERSLRNVGAATTIYGKSVEEALEAQSRLTGIADERLLPAFATIVRVTRNSERAFEDLALAQDVARATGRDLGAVSLALARAEAGNVTSLQRLGVILPKSITQLKARERAISALAIVQKRFAGSAEDFADTTAGSLERLDVASGELSETVGTALAPTVREIADGLNEWLSDADNLERVQRTTQELVKEGTAIFRGLANALRTVRSVLSPVVDLLGGFENAAELAFGVFFIRKIAGAVVALRGLTAAAGTATAATAAAGTAGTGAGLATAGAALATAGAARANLGVAAVAGGFLIGQQLQQEFPVIERTARSLGEAVGRFVDGGKSAADKFLESGEYIERRAAELLAAVRSRRAAEAIPQTGSEGGLAASIAASRAAGAQEAPAAGRQIRGATSSFNLRRLRVELTKTTADDLALFRERASFLQRTIDQIEAAGVRGRNDRVRLEGLYQQLIDVDGAIGDIEQAARDARAAAADDRKRKAEEEKLRREEERQQALEEKRLAAEALRDERQRRVELREARLQNRVARAELTENENDDRRTIRALIRFYRQQRDSLRRRGALIQAEQAETNRLSAISRLRGLRDQRENAAGQRFDVFQEAANQFRAFGSNIAGRNGILSGQDARAALASTILQRGQSQAEQVQVQQLTEAQKQTLILESIAAAFHGRGAKTMNREEAREHVREQAIRSARLAASVVSF